jgi:hypothetical protein
VVAASVSVAGAVVVLNVAVSHPLGCPAVYETLAVSPLSAPPPPLVMETVCAAGFAPPAVAVKLTVVGESAIAGPAPTVNVTLTFCGLLLATGEATATVAV